MKNLNVNVKFALGEKVGTTGWISNYIQNLELEIRSTKAGFLEMYYTEKGQTPFKSHFLCGQIDQQLAANVGTGVLQEYNGLAVIWECLEATESPNHHEDFFIEHATKAGEKFIWSFLTLAADYLNDFIADYDDPQMVDKFEIQKTK